MSAKFSSSVSSLLILIFSATFASAQNVLLFTFDDSGPNVTATVTGSFDTAELSLFLTDIAPPDSPDAFVGATANFLTLGTTTVGSIDLYSGANTPGPNAFGESYLAGFPSFDPSNSNFPTILTPLSEYFQIDALLSESDAIIGLAQGQTVFDADALANNVIVFNASSIGDLGDSGLGGDSSFLSTTPFTVLSDPSGQNTIQFALAVPEPSTFTFLLFSAAGTAGLRRRK